MVVGLAVSGATVLAVAGTGGQAPDRLAALQREAESLARQEKTLLVELRQLEVERNLRGEELRRTELDLEDVGRQRADAAARIASLEGEVASRRPELAARLTEIYKLGRPGYARLLLDVEGLKGAMRAYRAVTALIEADRQLVVGFRRSVDEMRATERTLAERTRQIEALQAQALAARQSAARAVAAHAARIAQIDAQRDMNARLVGELQAAHQKLAELAPPRSPVAVASANTPLVSLRGAIDWPAAGRLIARFGPYRDPRFGTTTLQAGVEIAAMPGSPAHAVHDGVVAYAEPFAGFGNLVILDHGNEAYSLYGYLDSIGVARGARVARGQALGTVGQSPAGKPGLYFELRIDGKAVDPVQWLKKR